MRPCLVALALCAACAAAARAGDLRNFDDAQACDTERYGRFCRALLDRGVYAPASQFEAWFPSLVHDDEQIAHTLLVATEAFAEAVA